MSTQEQQLCQLLADLPARFGYRYTQDAAQELLRSLFWSLAGGKADYMRLLFPDGSFPDVLKLSDAQGAVEGAEYTEAARGRRCGHIFKAGEASYMCRTCGTDETCCLCSRCFDSTDHVGHMVRISISVGNSGCCDCGDDEAWKTPMLCTIHSDMQSGPNKGKGKEAVALPSDLVNSLRMTIGRVFDYICDVISCSPEQLRQSKTKESIVRDEEASRLSSKYYGAEAEPCNDFALILWNDEKHTAQEVQDQVARACSKRRDEAAHDAWETDAVGRSILKYSSDIARLLSMAKIMENIRVTVTIRSARDTFREQMCGTLVEWLSDISGCSVGSDSRILRELVCDEVMKPWRQGSLATHTSGLIDDEDEDDQNQETRTRIHGANVRFIMALQAAAGTGAELQMNIDIGGLDEEDEEDEDEDEDEDADMGENDDNHSPSSSLAGGGEAGNDDDDVMMVDARGDVGDLALNWSQSGQALEEDEATMAGYPPPPPPPASAGQAVNTTVAVSVIAPLAQRIPLSIASRERDGTPSDSDTAEPAIFAKANADIPKTPGRTERVTPRPGRYWIETPHIYTQRNDIAPAEDVFQRVRLDWLLLFDLRMWKQVRNDLRALYISTVVSLPAFKRVLALRFASLYTILAQLYLVGDREPDHSIINLSLQMLTTPSITAEIVERGNFMSSLLAILYTFLTTRQVGHPWDVSPDAILAFESGSVTNRRMYHFYQDLKYLFGSPHVQERVRSEPRYLMQFLDLVKLHQCIGPNVRAVVEHVEYEADAWITASLVTRQINLQARNLAEAFRECPQDEIHYLQHAIRFTTKTVILNAIGAERHRFKQGEIKDEVKFKSMGDFEFDPQNASYDVVEFVVEKDPISFHHALHYTLSWLLECGRSLPAANIKTLMSFTAQELRSKPRLMGRPSIPKQDLGPEDYLMALFDFPLRVCAWLAQIKANMWVRNGISLRHQAGTYRGVGQRDVSHHRDIFLLQTAMVVCNPSRVLASIVDRFGMDHWIKGFFEQKSEAQDDAQHLDIAEDMIHLLIILLSDRTSLIADESNTRMLAMRRDITHVLCFKPLSFNEICNKLPEKYQEQEDFHSVLDEMATFKPPEGVSDVGTFELRPEYIEEIDPYIAHYSKNQREESEMAYRRKMAKKTGKHIEDIIFEPKPRPVLSGLFEGLGQFTSTGMFAQILFYCLLYPLVAHKLTPSVPLTRLETFLQVVLHLILIAILEDKTDEAEPSVGPPASFVHMALTSLARSNFLPDAGKARTIVSLLNIAASRDEFKSAHPKIALVLRRLKQKRPLAFESSFARMGIAVDRVNTASPANISAEEERERRKTAALSRQAKVMAQFQQQQKSFLENQAAIDWGSDLESEEEEMKQSEDRRHNWKYPSGTCILCQEEADDRRLYGTFALMTESRIFRLTDFQDPDVVREASQTPCSLDRSAEDIRPFGIARENRKMVEKLDAHGEVFLAEKQTIGKGHTISATQPGAVASGCGHIMHYRCFEMYYEATNRRHGHQIARHHPEDTRRNEFVCPLCKALGNTFLPIIWKGLEESFPGYLEPQSSFEDFLDRQMKFTYLLGGSKAREVDEPALPTILTPSVPGSLVETLTNSHPVNEPFWGRDELDVQSSVLGTPASSSFSLTGTPEPKTSHALAPAVNGHIVGDLLSAYRRLRDTMRLNEFQSRHGNDEKAKGGESLCSSDTLVQAVSFSISAVEIQQRGIEGQPGTTLVDKIPEQVVGHLRVLAETASSYVSIGARYSDPDSYIETEFRTDIMRQHCQLFMCRYSGSGTPSSQRPMDVFPPLLSVDCFHFLVECAYALMPAHKGDVSNMLRLCYLAEMVKVVHHMSCNMHAAAWRAGLARYRNGDAAMQNFAAFASSVTQLGIDHDSASGAEPRSHDRKNEGFVQPGVDTLENWYMFVKKYALTFLRKSVVFLHVKYGVDFSSHVPSVHDPDADELDRLTEALRVPTFDSVCAALTENAADCGWPSTTQALVSGWIKHQVVWRKARSGYRADPTAVVSHPGIFELIGLPRTYDTLIEEATRRKCPTTGKDLTDPVICLFCGELLCSQSTCCQKAENAGRGATKIGGAQQHMRT